MKPITIDEIIIKPVFDTGSMQRGMNELSKKVRALKQEFDMLKTSISLAAAPLLNLILPVADSMLGVFREVFDIAGAVFTVLFGTPSAGLEKAAAASGKLNESQKSLGKTTAKTAKAANKAMASFEELNVLSRQAGALSATAAGESEKKTDGPFNKWLEGLADLLEPARAAVARLREELDRLASFAYSGLLDFYESFLKPLGYWVLGEGLPRFIDAVTNGLAMIGWQMINDALHMLWINLQPFAQSVGEGLLWLWETVLVPLGVWAVNTVLPEVIMLLANAFAFVNEAIEAAKPALIYLWEEFLAPIAQWRETEFLKGLPG